MQLLLLVFLSFSAITANAVEAISLSPSGPGIGVFPAVAPVNTIRTITVVATPPNGCVDFGFTLDSSKLASDNVLSVQTIRTYLPCDLPSPVLPARGRFEFNSTTVGKITIRWDQLPGQDLHVETIAAKIHSKYDVNGMWSDPATNGSGIAVHHARSTSDAAFGTWFLFNYRGVSQWVSLQSALWQEDGSVLEGLLYVVLGGCSTANNADACPSRGFVLLPNSNVPIYEPAIAQIRFQSASSGTAAVYTLRGQLLFTSNLAKLAF